MYESQDTTVKLIRHRSLGCLRILKLVKRKDRVRLPEAEILLAMNHPGIPILYDMMEDERYFYLIEEYVEGISLRDYVLDHQFSPEQITNYALQLCQIIEYLHNNPIPILYLDIKPEHIILQGDMLKLIDYGIACQIGDCESIRQTYGTESYAAPEQYLTGYVDRRSDIYSLGRVLREMTDHSEQKPSIKLLALVDRMTEEDADLRPNSIVEIREAIEGLKTATGDTDRGILLNKIAVVGNERGVGTTHIAISLTVFLSRKGICTYYRNQSDTPVLQRMLETSGLFAEKEGIIYHKDFRAVMDYGPAVIPPKDISVLQVIDCGTDHRAALQADFILYVIGSRKWMDRRLHEALLLNNVAVCVNPRSITCGLELSKSLCRKVYGFPLDKDAFGMDKAKRRFFECIGKDYGFLKEANSYRQGQNR